MATSLPIGDFSRATHMSVKTLRYYHSVGLLEPADVDRFTGHRRYGADQIPLAQVIRRFRALDMPVEEIRGILAAPDLPARNELIAGHLGRLQDSLARTRKAVTELQELLGRPGGAPDADISHRSVAQARAAAITAVIDVADASAWLPGAIGELRATIGAQGLAAAGAGRDLRGRAVHRRARAGHRVHSLRRGSPAGRPGGAGSRAGRRAGHHRPPRSGPGHRPGLRRAGRARGPPGAGRGRPDP
jgi:DNA-binding transcriptional MerR regulator